MTMTVTVYMTTYVSVHDHRYQQFPGSRRPLSMDLNEDASDSSSDYPGKACTGKKVGSL